MTGTTTAALRRLINNPSPHPKYYVVADEANANYCRRLIRDVIPPLAPNAITFITIDRLSTALLGVGPYTIDFDHAAYRHVHAPSPIELLPSSSQSFNNNDIVYVFRTVFAFPHPPHWYITHNPYGTNGVPQLDGLTHISHESFTFAHGRSRITGIYEIPGTLGRVAVYLTTDHPSLTADH